MRKLINKIKQLFKKNKPTKNNQTKTPERNQQAEVKKRLKSLGYFDD